MNDISSKMFEIFGEMFELSSTMLKISSKLFEIWSEMLQILSEMLKYWVKYSDFENISTKKTLKNAIIIGFKIRKSGR